MSTLKVSVERGVQRLVGGGDGVLDPSLAVVAAQDADLSLLAAQ